jgi:hypothetical protein
MPDVQSIPLGGGTLVQHDSNVRMMQAIDTPPSTSCLHASQSGSVTIGPGSVEYRIKQEALCFGGSTCTATDVAIAAGIAPEGIGNTLPTLAPQMVYAATREIKKKIEAAIDSMKAGVHISSSPIQVLRMGVPLKTCCLHVKRKVSAPPPWPPWILFLPLIIFRFYPFTPSDGKGRCSCDISRWRLHLGGPQGAFERCFSGHPPS